MTALAFAALAAASLYEQSVARMLEQRFRAPKVSYLVMTVETRNIFAARWARLDEPIAPGSLVKPFIALAAKPDAEFECRASECWLPKGHGRLRLREAIAHSCNAWFLRVAATLRPEDVAQLRLPGAPSGARALIGLGDSWRVTPAALMAAYGTLAADPAAAEIREGMALSAASGTGKLVHADCLIKTGTAPCSHPQHGLGDGLALCLFPAREPKYILLVNVHGTTGANASKVAGEMIRSIRAIR